MTFVCVAVVENTSIVAARIEGPRLGEARDVTPGISVGQALADAVVRLKGGTQDALALLAHVTGASRALLQAFPERLLPAGASQTFTDLVERRAQGWPLAYLTGHCEFWSLDLVVTPNTLIPRPDTECLVEQALARMPRQSVGLVADLGTGSGAIALALAHERPRWQVIAIDASAAALEVARANACRLGIANVEFRCGHWLAPLTGAGGFDLIVANPPYVAPGDLHLVDLRHEPLMALVAEDGGFAALKVIAAGARVILRSGGALLMEHGHDQGVAMLQHLRALGYEDVADVQDWGGVDRVVVGCWQGGRFPA